MTSKAEAIVAMMAQGAEHADVQLVQTQFKLAIADGWQIPAGARILEIGCGQGDMTAVLAEAVGSRGHVTAVDIADPTYGAPISLGESARRLLESPLGQRIEFRFNLDVLDPSVTFEPASFDYVVLTHASWYFASVTQLADVLRRVRPWAKRLCVSEWNMTPQSIEQVPHMLAVLIQGQIEAFKATSDANIRTPISLAALKRLLGETGWTPTAEAHLDAPYLQDARWEIDLCRHEATRDLAELGAPPRLVSLIESQLDVLGQLVSEHPVHALSSFAIVAE